MQSFIFLPKFYLQTSKEHFGQPHLLRNKDFEGAGPVTVKSLPSTFTPLHKMLVHNCEQVIKRNFAGRANCNSLLEIFFKTQLDNLKLANLVKFQTISILHP